MTSRFAPELTLAVPTLGRSPFLPESLEALRQAAGDGVELLIIAPKTASLGLPDLSSGTIVHVPEDAGFAGACNAAFERSASRYFAIVNDDAIVGPEWSRRLLAALDSDPDCAAVQGVVLQLGQPELIDGAGLAWNRWWQAVQRRRGLRAEARETPRAIFGVSGTAAIYRREALASVLLDGREVFDGRLGSYYEDVDLACRLRGAGYGALLVPGAWARHAGGASSVRAARWRWRQVYGNRLLVLARLFGRSFGIRLPRVWMRDWLDFVGAAAKGDGDRLVGICGGWFQALRKMPQFARLGPPLLPLSELERFQEGVAGRGRPQSAQQAS